MEVMKNQIEIEEWLYSHADRDMSDLKEDSNGRLYVDMIATNGDDKVYLPDELQQNDQTN